MPPVTNIINFDENLEPSIRLFLPVLLDLPLRRYILPQVRKTMLTEASSKWSMFLPLVFTRGKNVLPKSLIEPSFREPHCVRRKVEMNDDIGLRKTALCYYSYIFLLALEWKLVV